MGGGTHIWKGRDTRHLVINVLFRTAHNENIKYTFENDLKCLSFRDQEKLEPHPDWSHLGI